MDLSNDKIKGFAVRLSRNNGDSFKKNIEILMNLEPHDIAIDKLISVTDDYDRVLLFGMDE